MAYAISIHVCYGPHTQLVYTLAFAWWLEQQILNTKYQRSI